jgi:hypothetical protein
MYKNKMTKLLLQCDYFFMSLVSEFIQKNKKKKMKTWKLNGRRVKYGFLKLVTNTNCIVLIESMCVFVNCRFHMSTRKKEKDNLKLTIKAYQNKDRR